MKYRMRWAGLSRGSLSVLCCGFILCSLMCLTNVRAAGIGHDAVAFFPSNLYYITKLRLSQVLVLFLVVAMTKGQRQRGGHECDEIGRGNVAMLWDEGVNVTQNVTG